jgi:signal peptide peptidase SppA
MTKQTALFDAESNMHGQAAMPFALESFWAIEPNAFARLRESLAAASPDRIAVAATPSAADTTDPGYELDGGVAVIRFEGVVSKRDSIWSRFFGGRAVTTRAAASLKAAVADPAVKSILFIVDSPGGTVDGTADLGDALFAARAQKPVVAFAEDLMASAAYWIGAQASELVGNATAAVGSIGVFSVLPDISRLAKNVGIEVNVVRSAPGKGTGTMGAAVTDAQLADVQKHVDALHQQFVGAVARGRGISIEKTVSLADGRLHVGQAAVTAGLLDRIAPLSSVLADMQASAIEPAPAFQPMANTPSAIEPGQKEDLMADATPTVTVKMDPALTQALGEIGASIKTTNERLDALAKEHADLKAKVSGVSENVVSMTTERQTLDLLERARTEVKLTTGNEKVLDPAIRAMAAIDIKKAEAFVESLPKLGKGEGSVQAAAGQGPGAAPARHRYDVMGPAACAASKDPRVQKYAEKIRWIAEQEKANGREFRTAAAAFAAYDSAHVGRAA